MELKDSNLYSRWLNKELSKEELAQLKASGDLELLEKIVEEIDTWEMPPMKGNSYQLLKQKINSPKQEDAKVIRLKRSNFWLYGIAASIALVAVSAYFIFFNKNIVTYQCFAGKTLTVTLPDNSIVNLIGKSSISINEDDFIENRNVTLTGQGYFEVTKKGNFKVEFEKGNVKVLGTKFDILSGKGLASIKCFEGKVMVENNQNQQQVLLTPGKAIRLKDGKSATFEFNETSPDWTKGESVFKDAPLQEVIDALSIQYGVEFSTNNVNLERYYSGKFTHKDLNIALEMVFIPMGIKYSIKHPDNKTTIVDLN